MSSLVRRAATVFWLLLAPVVGVVFWAQITFSSRPEDVLALMPSQATALRAQLARAPWDAGFSPSEKRLTLELAHRLLAASPLDFTPLVVASQVDAKVDPRVALKEVLRRNPRSIPARIQAAQAAADAGNFSDAFRQLGRIQAIAPQESELVARAGLILARADGGITALKPFIVAGENWAGDLLRRLNNSDVDLDKLLVLNQVNPAAAADYVTRVLTERGVEAAFVAWFGMLPEAEAQQFSWPYDRQFKQKRAPPPFNWQVDMLNTEYLHDGGLFATYDGRGSPRLAAQTVMLDAGRYSLAVDMTGETQDKGGSFKWIVNCFPEETPLASLDVGQLAEKKRTYALLFDVPEAGCHGQRIALYGAPGEFPTRARSVTTDTRILRPGDQE